MENFFINKISDAISYLLILFYPLLIILKAFILSSSKINYSKGFKNNFIKTNYKALPYYIFYILIYIINIFIDGKSNSILSFIYYFINAYLVSSFLFVVIFFLGKKAEPKNNDKNTNNWMVELLKVVIFFGVFGFFIWLVSFAARLG